MILAGDIGGTKTVLALFSPDQDIHEPIQETIFPSSRYASLENIIADYLKDKEVELSGATFGVAGPVVRGEAEITNLPWVIRADDICRAFDLPAVNLLNDLEAIAASIPFLHESDLVTLKPGKPEPQGAIAVIAPGTGLGEAFLVWGGDRYYAYPTEGGHVSFAPGTAEELDLLVYLQPRFGHVSFERVCSGSGIPNLYDFLRDSGRYRESPELRQMLEEAEDRTPIIMNAAQEGTDDLCSATLNLFVKILAGETGNMALQVLATGGVYLGGGIPPRILPHLKKSKFLEDFTKKGRFSDLLERIPIHVINQPKSALFGAAYDGLREFDHV